MSSGEDGPAFSSPAVLVALLCKRLPPGSQQPSSISRRKNTTHKEHNARWMLSPRGLPQDARHLGGCFLHVQGSHSISKRPLPEGAWGSLHFHGGSYSGGSPRKAGGTGVNETREAQWASPFLKPALCGFDQTLLSSDLVFWAQQGNSCVQRQDRALAREGVLSGKRPSHPPPWLALRAGLDAPSLLATMRPN